MEHGEASSALPAEPARTVVLSGDLDVSGVAALRSALEALDQRGVVDMRAVRYLDSSALREFALVARRFGKHEIALIVGSATVRRVLRIVEFERLFRIEDAGGPLT